MTIKSQNFQINYKNRKHIISLGLYNKLLISIFWKQLTFNEDVDWS